MEKAEKTIAYLGGDPLLLQDSSAHLQIIKPFCKVCLSRLHGAIYSE